MLTSPLPPFTRLNTAHCPACGQGTLSLAASQIPKLVELSENEEVVFEALLNAAKPETDGWLTCERGFNAIYDGDLEGGPEPHEMYATLYAAFDGLALKIAPFGYTVERSQRKGARVYLLPGQTDRAARPLAGKSGGFRRQFRPVACRCCRQQIASPTLEHVMCAYRLQPRERQILRAIEGATGRVASNAWLLDLMFADDPVPKNYDRKYSALKVAISNARKKLLGSGVTIKSAGYGKGFFITDEVSQ